eukprot:1635415-Prymnesium_polylepis.2
MKEREMVKSEATKEAEAALALRSIAEDEDDDDDEQPEDEPEDVPVRLRPAARHLPHATRRTPSAARHPPHATRRTPPPHPSRAVHTLALHAPSRQKLLTNYEAVGRSAEERATTSPSARRPIPRR